MPTYVEYKAVFDVVLVNICLPFQHKQVVQTVGAWSHFCFHMGKAPLGTQSCVPQLCFTSTYHTFVKLISAIGADLVVRMSSKYRIVSLMLLLVVGLLYFTAIKPWS